MRLVDLFWMTRPEFTSRAVPTWLDIVLPIALGGLWLALFAFNLKQMPLLPLGDPKLAEAIEHYEHWGSQHGPGAAPHGCLIRKARQPNPDHFRGFVRHGRGGARCLCDFC